MKTKALKTEKKDNPIFAFLPEMVLDHLNEAKPTEITKENSNEPTTKKITISAEPEIPNLDSIIITKKEKIKPIETVEKPNLEKPDSETDENPIIRFLKKIKI